MTWPEAVVMCVAIVMVACVLISWTGRPGQPEPREGLNKKGE